MSVFWRPRGCILWFDFGTLKGNTVYDLSGQGNHGTIYGAKWLRSYLTGALSFDGVDDYVTTPIDSQSIGDVFTAMILINMKRINIPTEQDFLSCQYGGVYGWSFYNIKDTKRLVFTIKVAGTWYSIVLVPSASIDTWYFLATSFVKEPMSGYVNGEAVTPMSVVGSVDKGV